jgi:GDP-L-fucose synthase
MKILVTGGTGMVGRYLQKIAKKYPSHEWVFISSKQYNLTIFDDVQRCFQENKPDYVIHLAANVGGLYKHLNEKVNMFRSNFLMNIYLVDACHQYNVQRGIFCLSTCIFPECPPSFPMTEEMIMAGPPHPSNDNYAYAKRMLYQHCMNYNQQYGRQYICVSPVNLFGKYDNFNLQDSHVIPGMIHRMYLAKQEGNALTLPGTGRAIRQFLYAGDFAKIIVDVLFGYQGSKMMICTSNIEISIAELIQKVKKYMNFTEDINYDTTKSDGILRKTASNQYFTSVFPDFKYSDFDQKLASVVNWFCREYSHNAIRL